MGRRKAVDDDDDDDDLPTPPPGYVAPAPAWDRAPIVEQVQKILDAMEVPPIDRATMTMFCRSFYRRQKFAETFRNERYGAEERIVLVCRAILESDGNGNALIEPIANAVALCMRPEWTSKGVAWIEAFDQIPLLGTLQTLVDLFGEKAAAEHLKEVLRRKLWAFFGPDVVPAAKPVKVKPPKPPASVTRIPVIEKRIALGVKLLELKAKSRRNNDFSELRKRHFGDVEPKLAMQATSVAKVYGAKPEIYRRVSWQALVELSAPSLSAAARLRFESAVIEGKEITGIQIKRARGRRPNGRPRQSRPAARMAA
jgi:hypothetical protein